jgi:hypothetical protein
MQFLKLTARLLMVSLVLMCYSSCQKDNILYNEITPVQNHPEGESISLYQKQEVQKAVKQLLSDRRSLVRSFSENYEIDTTRVLKMKFNEEHTTYTLNIKHNYPGKLINLVFKENNFQLSQPYVFEYHMSPQTVDRYYANQKQLLSYEGTIKQARFYDYFTEQSTRNNTDCGFFKNFVSIKTQTGGSNDPDINPQDGTWIGNSGFPHFDPFGGFDPPSNGGGGEQCDQNQIQLYIDLSAAWHYLYYRACNKVIGAFNSDCENFSPGTGILFGQNNDLNNYAQHEHNPYSDIMLECLDHDITAKMDELKAQNLYDPCAGNEITVDVDMLAKALCYGCIKSSGLTVENLEDAYHEALGGMAVVDLNKIMDQITGFEDLISKVDISNAELIKIMSSNDCVNRNPECKNCSVSERNAAWIAHDKARDLLKCAVNKLSNYNGNDQNIKALLEKYFKTSSSVAVTFLDFVIRFVNFQSWNANYESVPQGELFCGESTNAWSYPSVQATSIKLCNPNFWNLSENDRPITIIHEMFHLYFVAGDWAYQWDSEKFEELNSLQAFTNADNFAHFIKELCQ